MNHCFTTDYINRRIEHAGATLRCLRIKHPSTQLAQMRPEASPWDDNDLYPMPSARDVTLMDEALSWMTLIPNQVHRRLVSLRSKFHPTKMKHMHSWRMCGEIIQINHVSAKSWHGRAIALLADTLSGTEIKSPLGCNVISNHISFDHFHAAT